MTLKSQQGRRAVKKDGENSSLEGLAQAYVSKASMLQSQLVSSLDTLDAVQKSHEQEFTALAQDRDRVKARLQRYIEFVKEVKSERDDMRDAVMKLIEKVELSNDYSNWPHSQLFLSSPAEALMPMKPAQYTAEHDELLSYATSMIETLTRERDNERRNHAQTREISEARILSLEAKLSRRDAELESCVASADHMHFLRERTPHLRPKSRAAQSGLGREPILTKEEVISMLDVNSTRNKVLEAEIKVLAKRLEQAKEKARPAEIYDPSPSSSRSAQPGQKRLEVANQGTLLSLEREVNDLGSKIDAFAKERKVLSKTITIAHKQDSKRSPALDQNASDEDILQRLAFVEVERDRLRRSESLLRDQLNDAREDAQQRELELMSEISALRRELQQRIPLSTIEIAREDRPDRPGGSPDLTPGRDGIPPSNAAPRGGLLAPHDGEMSMELATPLMMTSIISGPATSPSSFLSHFTPSPSMVPASLSDHHPTVDIQHVLPLSEDQQLHSNGHAQIHIHPEESFYVDPPSIPLPPSPEISGLSEWEENTNSPILSQSMISASAFPLPPEYTPSVAVANQLTRLEDENSKPRMK